MTTTNSHAGHDGPDIPSQEGAQIEAMDILAAHAEKSAEGVGVMISDTIRHGVEISSGKGHRPAHLTLSTPADADEEADDFRAKGRTVRRFTDRHTVTRTFL